MDKSDARYTPFAIVEGTISKDPQMRMMCAYRARTIAQGWEAWQKHRPRWFKDTQISQEDMARYSLILVGGPEANAVTARLAGNLPLKIESQAISLEGKSFASASAGVNMVWPHPLNKDRYVQIIAGNTPAGLYHAGRTPDDMDYVISDGRIAPDEDLAPGAFVALGAFDQSWRISEALAAKPDVQRATWPIRKAPVHASPADAPGQTLWLSDALESRAEGSFTGMERDLDWKGRPMVIGGKTHKSGIAVTWWRANHSADWDLGAKWKRLRATLGVSFDPKLDEQKKKDAVRAQFIVKGDGKELFRSNILDAANPSQELDIDVSNVKTLTLEVTSPIRWQSEIESLNFGDIRLER